MELGASKQKRSGCCTPSPVKWLLHSHTLRQRQALWEGGITTRFFYFFFFNFFLFRAAGGLPFELSD
jgi:hypothetical protein